jgi:hypothetical protein
MDLGRNDFFVLLFFQFFEESSGKYTIRIIKDYHNNYEDLEHYADYIKEYVRQDESVDLREIGLPHDGVVVELTARGRTRQEILADYGVKNTVILDKAGETDSIDNVRFEMPHIWIDSQCGYIENCFLYYTKKWNDLLNIWMSEPVRNEWKHGADAVRYMVQYVQTFLKTSSHEDEEDNRESSGDMDL